MPEAATYRTRASRHNESMKISLDLPDALVKQVKAHARGAGWKLKDAIAELLRRGLAAQEPEAGGEAAAIGQSKVTGLPVIQCKHPAAPGEEMTPERVAAILLDQEVAWQRRTGR